MAALFDVISISVVPQDTGVSQYINIEIVIDEPMLDIQYAKPAGSIELYSGESVGEL